MTPLERCDLEIAAVKALLLAGHPDVEGLCLALADWSGEKRLIEAELAASASVAPEVNAAPCVNILKTEGK